MEEITLESFTKYCIHQNVDKLYGCRLQDFIRQYIRESKYISYIFISDVRKPLPNNCVQCLIVMDLHPGDKATYGHFKIPNENHEVLSMEFGFTIRYSTLAQTPDPSLAFPIRFADQLPHDFISLTSLR